jgi:hypothetical protein
MRGTLVRCCLFALVPLAACTQNATITGSENQMSLNRDVQVPQSQSVSVEGLACSVEGGNVVVTAGTIDLRGMAVRLDFRNNQKGTHTATRTQTFDMGRVKLAGDSVSTVNRTAPDSDARVWMQLVDRDENPISDEVFIGRCGQAAGAVTTRAPVAASATLTTATRNCGRSNGPVINVATMLDVQGMKVKFIFRESEDPSAPVVATWISPAGLTLVNENQSINLAKQPSQGGVGGNPWIYATFVDSTGRALSEEILLGRCGGDMPEPTDPNGG